MKKLLIILGICAMMGTFLLIDLKITPFIVYLCNVYIEHFDFIEIALALQPLYCILFGISLSSSKTGKSWSINLLNNKHTLITLPRHSWIFLLYLIVHLALIPHYDNYYRHEHYNTYGRIIIHDNYREHIGIADKFGNELIPPYYKRIIDYGDYANLYKKEEELYSTYYFLQKKEVKYNVNKQNNTIGSNIDNITSEHNNQSNNNRSISNSFSDNNITNDYIEQESPQIYSNTSQEHVPSPHFKSVDVQCSNCGGEGFIHKNLYMGNGHIFNQKRRCGFCNGKGTIRETQEEWY